MVHGALTEASTSALPEYVATRSYVPTGRLAIVHFVPLVANTAAEHPNGVPRAPTLTVAPCQKEFTNAPTPTQISIGCPVSIVRTASAVTVDAEVLTLTVTALLSEGARSGSPE